MLKRLTLLNGGSIFKKTKIRTEVRNRFLLVDGVDISINHNRSSFPVMENIQ